MNESLRSRRAGRVAGVLLATLGLIGGSALAANATPIAGPVVGATAAATSGDLTQYVDTYLGTQPGAADQGTGGGAGNNFPGADVPFGMVQWSPDTVTMQPGGYYYQDNRIRGFSMTHLSGAGCYTYQDLPFMPYVGSVTDSPATDPNRYVSTFSHANEQATPGYYGVTLDSGAKAELTATQRTGSARFTYPAGSTASLLVNTSGSISGTSDSQVTIGKNFISGYAVSGQFCGQSDSYKIYFYAQFDQNFDTFGTWRNGTVTPNKATEQGGQPALPAVTAANKQAAAASNGAPATPKAAAVRPQDVTASGPGTGGYVTFDTTKSKTVNVRVGISFTSADGAKANLSAENNGGKNFDQVAAAAKATWNSRLNEIQVAGGTDEQKKTFYSSLYHAFLQPNVFNDDNGQYAGFDGRVHTVAKGHAIYTNFSGWDIYRSESQLLALLAPSEMADIAQTMVLFAQQGGSWDRWTVANDYTGVMNGDPYHIIVANAYAFGATGFDAKTALQLMYKGATQVTDGSTGYVERPGLGNYEKLGYVPGAAADTLEYTSADFAIAQFAQRLGDSATYNQFMTRSQNWQNLFNPTTGYLEPRNADGSFPGGYNPASSSGYVEGNGAQYSWMVPYNESSLIASLGTSTYNQRLDTFFTKLNVGTQQPYAFLSNEPTSETPWLYNFSGEPYQTQATVRRVENELYNSSPSGLQGNDDLGQMAAWYVWSAMGLYPEIPGRAELLVGSPLFTQVKINTPTGHKFTINAPNAATANPYVTGLKVNGQTSTQTYLPESFARNGGTLDFTLSSTPDKTWGTAATDAPPSFQQGQTTDFTYTDPSRLVIPVGKSDTASVGAQDLTGKGTTVSWQANPPAGVTVTPSSGTITVPAGAKATAPVTVAVTAGATGTVYSVPITYSTSSGALPNATLSVLVAEPGSFTAALNNVGISPDSNTSVADFDGDGFSYSADQLAKDGATPGATLTVNGVALTWPNAAVGALDNVAVGGQTINVDNASSTATMLQFLGSSSNGNTSGTVTITYTDGTTSTGTLGFSDWTLGGGGAQPAFGNTIALTTPYRNSMSGGNQSINTYVFASTPIALTAGKTVQSITLPSTTTGGGLIHIFAFGVG